MPEWTSLVSNADTRDCFLIKVLTNGKICATMNLNWFTLEEIYMKTRIFISAILCLCALLTLSAFALPTAVETDCNIQECGFEAELYSDYYDLNIDASVKGGVLDAEYLYIKSTDNKNFTIKMSGISVADEYVTNLTSSEVDTAEYNWEVSLNLADSAYAVSTSSWAFEPGLNEVISTSDMQHSLWRLNGTNFYWVCDVEMSYTSDSITWNFTLPEGETLDLSEVLQVEAFVNGGQQDYVARCYNVEEEEVEIVASGTCGTNLTWTLDAEGTLAISGVGAMDDYIFFGTFDDEREAPPWGSVGSSIKKVEIADGVINVGDYAFYDCTRLTSITIPDSVKTIGDYAFNECTRLTSITIPDSVTTIGTSAFKYCHRLTSITIPDSVTSIGVGAFYSCQSLEKATILSRNVNFVSSVFGRCDNLTIYGYAGSTSETYAKENDIPFVALGEYLLGDIDGDGKVTGEDAILLLQYSVFPETYPIDYEGNVDFTKDGKIDAADAILLLQYSIYPELYPIT